MFIEFRKYCADGLIEMFNHTGIDRAILYLTDIESTVEKRSLFSMRPIFSALRDISSIVPVSFEWEHGRCKKIDKPERLILMSFNKVGRSCPSRRVNSPSTRFQIRINIGREKPPRTANIPTTLIDIKSMIRWGALASQMPFSGKESLVTSILHCFRSVTSEARRLRSYSEVNGCHPFLAYSMLPGRISIQVVIPWLVVFPGKDTCSGGTAYLTSGITPSKLHSFIGNTIDIRTFVKSGAFIA